MSYYAQRTARNAGFVSRADQDRLRHAAVLIAGCGLGGVAAELALRTGFTRLIVADGDTVAAHNLNRQAFAAADIGRNKAQALADRLRAIDPSARIHVVPEMLGEDRIPALVSQADLVIDTIDFLDARAILALHAEARRQGKTVLAPVAVGWGGAVFVFTPRSTTMAELAGLGGEADARLCYLELFMRLLQRYADALPPYVVKVVRAQMSQIVERKPCPISQLGGGTWSAAVLAVNLAVRAVCDGDLPEAPEVVVYDPLAASIHLPQETCHV